MNTTNKQLWLNGDNLRQFRTPLNNISEMIKSLLKFIEAKIQILQPVIDNMNQLVFYLIRKVTSRLVALHSMDATALPLKNTDGKPCTFDVGKTVWSRIDHSLQQIPDEVADPARNEMYNIAITHN